MLWSIWAKYRTCSLNGFPGRDVAWDQANEFMNLHVKSMDPKDPARIDSVIEMLNGLKSAECNLREALGEERTDPDEYSPVKAHHVQKVVDVLKENLGASMAELFGENRKKASPFGGGARPWILIRYPGGLIATEAARRTELVHWITSQLEMSPFPS